MGYVVSFGKWPDNGNRLCPEHLALASCVMLGCQTPIPSKGKQQIAVSRGGYG